MVIGQEVVDPSRLSIFASVLFSGFGLPHLIHPFRVRPVDTPIKGDETADVALSIHQWEE